MNARTLRRLPYKALQKLVVVEGVHTLVADGGRLAAAPRPVGAVELRRPEVEFYLRQGQAPGCEALARRLDEPTMHAFGCIDSGGTLTSFAWLHEGYAEPRMNHGYHLGTATGVRLADDAAFVFHVYTHPAYRGRGLVRAVLGKAAETLAKTRGIRRFATTTEIVNDAAFTALTRLGFEPAGVYWRFGVGTRVGGWYPRATPPIVRFGDG